MILQIYEEIRNHLRWQVNGYRLPYLFSGLEKILTGYSILLLGSFKERSAGKRQKGRRA